MSSPNRERVHRAVGAIVGLAVGDALGAPFEFRPAGTYRRRFPHPLVGGSGEMVGGGGWDPGEFTDDTQMALLVAESLLDHGAAVQGDLAARFRAWVASGPKDVGISTRAVLTSPVEPVTAARAYFEAHPGGAAGNGSLMRTVPAAVFFAEAGTDATMTAARRISEVTHGDPAAGEGCALYHELVRVALDGGDPLEAVPDALEGVAPAYRQEYERVLDPAWRPDDGPGNGSVWGALATAVWALRRSAGFEEAVVTAVDSGEDADTVGAITGGLAGARWGVGAIPSRWTTYLNGEILGRRYALADLQDIARRLAGTRPVPLQAEDPLIEPKEVRPGLWLANLAGARTAPRETAVISLCRTQGAFLDHPVRREVYLVDQEGDHNPALDEVMADVLATIEVFLDEGRPVLVHCHGGHSRTGLAFRAWLNHADGLAYDDALTAAQQVWPPLTTYNQSFEDHLRHLGRT